MVSKILPSDAGREFIPAAIEQKDVLEESRAKNLGRKLQSRDDGSIEPSQSDSGDPPPSVQEIEEALASPAIQNQDAPPPEGKPSGEESFAARKPIPPNPDFEPMRKSAYKDECAFTGWAVKEVPGADGTHSVIFGEGMTYESIGSSIANMSIESREEILAQARVEAEDIRRQASVEGIQKGYEQGMVQAREELRAEMTPVFEELRNSIKNVLDYRGEVLHLAEQEIFELAVLISKKVIHGELQLRPEVILEVVRHALDRAVGWGEATVQVNPEDYSFLEEHRFLLNEEGEGVTLVRTEANPSITRGGCVLESNFGEIDARLEKQVEAVENALRETLAEIVDRQSGESNDGPEESSAAPEALSESPAEEIPGLEEDQPSVQPFQPKELDAPPEEQEGQ